MTSSVLSFVLPRNNQNGGKRRPLNLRSFASFTRSTHNTTPPPQPAPPLPIAPPSPASFASPYLAGDSTASLNLPRPTIPSLTHAHSYPADPSELIKAATASSSTSLVPLPPPAPPTTPSDGHPSRPAPPSSRLRPAIKPAPPASSLSSSSPSSPALRPSAPEPLSPHSPLAPTSPLSTRSQASAQSHQSVSPKLELDFGGQPLSEAFSTTGFLRPDSSLSGHFVLPRNRSGSESALAALKHRHRHHHHAPSEMSGNGSTSGTSPGWGSLSGTSPDSSAKKETFMSSSDDIVVISPEGASNRRTRTIPAPIRIPTLPAALVPGNGSYVARSTAGSAAAVPRRLASTQASGHGYGHTPGSSASFDMNDRSSAISGTTLALALGEDFRLDEPSTAPYEQGRGERSSREWRRKSGRGVSLARQDSATLPKGMYSPYWRANAHRASRGSVHSRRDSKAGSRRASHVSGISGRSQSPPPPLPNTPPTKEALEAAANVLSQKQQPEGRKSRHVATSLHLPPAQLSKATRRVSKISEASTPGSASSSSHANSKGKPPASARSAGAQSIASESSAGAGSDFARSILDEYQFTTPSPSANSHSSQGPGPKSADEQQQMAVPASAPGGVHPPSESLHPPIQSAPLRRPRPGQLPIGTLGQPVDHLLAAPHPGVPVTARALSLIAPSSLIISTGATGSANNSASSNSPDLLDSMLLPQVSRVFGRPRAGTVPAPVRVPGRMGNLVLATNGTPKTGGSGSSGEQPRSTTSTSASGTGIGSGSGNGTDQTFPETPSAFSPVISPSSAAGSAANAFTFEVESPSGNGPRQIELTRSMTVASARGGKRPTLLRSASAGGLVAPAALGKDTMPTPIAEEAEGTPSPPPPGSTPPRPPMPTTALPVPPTEPAPAISPVSRSLPPMNTTSPPQAQAAPTLPPTKSRASLPPLPQTPPPPPPPVQATPPRASRSGLPIPPVAGLSSTPSRPRPAAVYAHSSPNLSSGSPAAILRPLPVPNAPPPPRPSTAPTAPTITRSVSITSASSLPLHRTHSHSQSQSHHPSLVANNNQRPTFRQDIFSSPAVRREPPARLNVPRRSLSPLLTPAITPPPMYEASTSNVSAAAPSLSLLPVAPRAGPLSVVLESPIGPLRAFDQIREVIQPPIPGNGLQHQSLPNRVDSRPRQSMPAVHRSHSQQYASERPSPAKPRARPPLPIGPRGPTLGSSPLLSSEGRDRNDSVSSVKTITPTRRGRSVSTAAMTAASSPSGPRFQRKPVQFKALTMDAAKWTLTRPQLQSVVSNAIRHSAEPRTIRLVDPDLLEGALPSEQKRLDLLSKDLKLRYQVLVRKRAAFLAALADDIPVHDRQEALDGLSECTAQLDSVAEELYVVTDQLSQLSRLHDVHAFSALALALHKLHASFLRQVAETQALRQQAEQLAAERDEAWKHAEDVAQEFDELSEKISTGLGAAMAPTAGDQSQPTSRRSSRVMASRKTSMRRTKAGLRSSSATRRSLSRPNSSASIGSSQPGSAALPQTVPPMPPIPRQRPGIRTSAISANRRSQVASVYDSSVSDSDSRALDEAQRELYAMLGMPMHDRMTRSWSLQVSPRTPAPSGIGLVPPRVPERPASLPPTPGLHNTMEQDRSAVLAAIGMMD